MIDNEKHSIEANGEQLTLARLVTIIFILLLIVVPIWQLVQDLAAHARGDRASVWPRACDAVFILPRAVKGGADQSDAITSIAQINASIRRQLSEYEDALQIDSPVQQVATAVLKPAMRRYLGDPGHKVIIGNNGWLYYRPDLRYVVTRPFLESRGYRRGETPHGRNDTDPRPAILQFKKLLAERGIDLILVPVPVKPCIYPQALTEDSTAPPLQNTSYNDLLKWLDENDIDYFDPTSRLLRMEQMTQQRTFLKTDTHWRADAVQQVAGDLTRFVYQSVNLPKAPDPHYQLQPKQVTNLGDIAKHMLDLGAQQDEHPAETVTIQQVRLSNGTLWQPDESADVMLLGDSFANIYSDGAMGWGQGGGLAELLSYELGRPIDTIILNDGGAWETRKTFFQQLLGAETAKHPDNRRLRLVIWQFAVRDLTSQSWPIMTEPSAEQEAGP